jgi:hypothetical protein
MNDQIQELAEQAGFNLHNDVIDGNDFKYEIEKFAELLVRECAEWINDNVGLIDQKALADLLKHFGLDK